MAFFGGDGSDVTITINGQAQGLQGAVSAAESSLQSLGRAVGQNTDAATGYRFTMQSLGNDFLNNLGTFGATVITLNSLLGVFGDLAGGALDVAQGVGQFVENLAQVAASDAWQVIETGAQQVEQLGQAMFDLNNQTEKNVFNWTYLYGGPNNGGPQAASALAAWTQQFSMQIPYTRQDLMSAVTTLSAEPGATPSAIEHQLSLLSDVAATQGRPDLTLSWAAMAALRASQTGKGNGGSFLMLMRDLNLNKGELAPYGYNENDASTFWPALEGYEKGKGSYGASKAIATETFWGAYSSFQDRIQNFQLAAGGTDVFGDVQKGSFFGNLKNDLTDFNSWYDGHQQQINQLANIIDQIYGAGLETGRNGLEQFMTALHGTGIDTTVLNDLADFGKALSDPTTQAVAREVGGMLGQLAGVAGFDLRGVFSGFWDGLTSTGIGQMLLDDVRNATQWLADPKNQQMLRDTGQILGQGIGYSLEMAATDFENLATDAQRFLQILTPDDLTLLAAAFTEFNLAIALTADGLGGLALEFADLGQMLQDYMTGNYYAMGQDAMKMASDYGNTIQQETQAYNQAVQQGTQLDVTLQQMKQQSMNGQVVPHTLGHLTEASSVTAARVQQEQYLGGGAGGRAAGQLGALMTEQVSAGMVGNLSAMTRAGQQVVGQFSSSLIQASGGQMNSVASHVAVTLVQAINARIAQELKNQNSLSALAALQGAPGRFAFGGGRAPW